MELQTVLFILSGGLTRNPDGSWRTTRFVEGEGDNFGMIGDYLRPKAGAVLFRNDPSLHIVAIGGKGQFKEVPDAPTVASVMRQELIENSVREDAISIEIDSGNTYGELLICARIVLEHSFERITILSNGFHLPRIEAMVEHAPRLESLIGVVEFASSEEILIKDEPETWTELLAKIYYSDAMQKRNALEQQGIRDIMEGRYRYNGGA